MIVQPVVEPMEHYTALIYIYTSTSEGGLTLLPTAYI